MNVDHISWKSTCLLIFIQRTVSLKLLIVPVTLILKGHLMLIQKIFFLLQRKVIITKFLWVQLSFIGRFLAEIRTSDKCITEVSYHAVTKRKKKIIIILFLSPCSSLCLSISLLFWRYWVVCVLMIHFSNPYNFLLSMFPDTSHSHFFIYLVVDLDIKQTLGREQILRGTNLFELVLMLSNITIFLQSESVSSDCCHVDME